MIQIRVFDHLETLDAFVVNPRFAQISETLGLSEWSPVVWIGRIFAMDNDFGEHWFDNWDSRESLALQAAAAGYAPEDLYIVEPKRFQDGRDGPSHSPELRRRFWTDVLMSLRLGLPTLFQAARENNARLAPVFPEDVIEDLEERIQRIIKEYGRASSPTG